MKVNMVQASTGFDFFFYIFIGGLFIGLVFFVAVLIISSMSKKSNASKVSKDFNRHSDDLVRMEEYQTYDHIRKKLD
jgi:hypothetical protein